jgi:hypothetical protein
VAIGLSMTNIACPAPTQYGGPIAVDANGFAARARLLCDARLADHASETCAFDPSDRSAAPESRR